MAYWFNTFILFFYPYDSGKEEQFDISHALSIAYNFFSYSDFCLLCSIVNEWFSCPAFSFCLSFWKTFSQQCTYSLSKELNVLLFNIRGLEEIVLLAEKYKIDCLILVGVVAINIKMIQRIFVNLKLFYQKGENARPQIFA